VKTRHETINLLQFFYLPSYAQYLLDEKLDAFVQLQQELGQQLDIPLLRAFKNWSPEDFKALSIKSSSEYLSYLAANKAAQYIQDSNTQWITNTLPFIDKHQVIAEDVSLIMHVRKKAFLHFLPTYCNNTEEMLQLIGEIDYFLTRHNAVATETYVNILQDKIIQHTHFIEKINATSPSAIYVFDIIDQKLVYANDKFKEVLGAHFDEARIFNIDHFSALVHPEHLPELKSYFKSLDQIAENNTSTIKYRVKNSKDQYRWVRSYDTVFKRNDDGSIRQIIGVIIDVNKEKTIGDELRRREEQLTEAQALAHIGSWSWQLETGEILWSDELYRIYNLDKNAVLRYDSLLLFNHPEDRTFVQQKIAKAIEKKTPTEFQSRILLTDGTIKNIHVTVEVRTNTFNNAVEILGTVQDVTERQMLLSHLQRNESLYKQAEVLANLGNWIWDIKTNTVEWTDQLYTIYGLKPQSEPITIERFLSLVHPEDRDSIAQSVTENINEDYIDRNFRIITPQGTVKMLRSIAQTQRNSNGQIENIYGTEQDITEQYSLIEKLQRSETLYKQAQSLAHIGNWSVDLLTNEISWSDELYNIYQLNKEQQITLEKWVYFIHPEEREEVLAYWQRCLREKQNYDKVHRIVLNNGTIKTLHRKGEFIYNTDGVPIKIAGTTQDITEQYRTQQELIESQVFIKKITDATPCIISSYNVLTDKYEFVNEGLQKLLGFEPKDAIGSGAAFFTELIHPADALDLIQKNIAALEEANTNPIENAVTEFTYRMRHKNGQYRWFNTYATVFGRNNQGMVERVLRISLDVTDQAQAREKIEEQELFIKQVADASPTVLYLFNNVSNTFTYINQEIYYVLGYTPEEVLAMGADVISSLYHPEDMHLLPERQLTGKRFQHSNSMIQYECRLKNKSNEWCWMVIREVIFKRNEAGLPIQILGAALDITKRKEMERSLLQNAYQLQQSNASLEEFAYVASHDLKEPLRKISTFGDRIIQTQQERLSDDGKIYLKKIIDASQRMQTMINDLLSISMITGDRSFQQFSLQTILAEVQQTLEYKIENQGASIIANNLPEANIVPSQFRQLFQNLLSNSLKFTRANVQPLIQIEWAYIDPEQIIDIHVNKANRYLKLDFIDNGIGFEEEYAGKIFQIFQRLHGRSEYEGTGIGLAICKKIVEHHGGTIYAQGYPEKGATFTIILPA
jgi:PAS domain S-box-containing protein